MVSSEVQRTLVKSRPELWAELSDPAGLARHLGELGEIRITKTKPEERVEWEADRISGIVSMKASGWGTKVTLSATREIGELEQTDTETAPERASAEPDSSSAQPGAPGTETEPSEPTGPTDATEAEATPQGEPTLEAESPTLEAEATTAGGSTPQAEATPEDEPTPEIPAAPELAVEPRRGFFSRLFRRRAQPASEPTRAPVATIAEPATETRPAQESAESAIEPLPLHAGSAIESLQARFQAEWDPAAAEPQPARETAPEAEPAPEPVTHEATVAATDEGPSQPSADISAALLAAEEVAVEEVTAVLTAVLDRLGAAHHRPFSRS